MRPWIRRALVLVALAGCAGSREEPPPPYVPPDREVQHVTLPADPAPASPSAGDSPEISRSVGQRGGVVVFWPRVIPRAAATESRDVAAALQDRIRALVERALPGRPVDVRPEPERVCPRAGCEAMTVGVLLLRQQNGCVALGMISGPGTSAAQLVPWVGQVDLRARMVPFREPPESQVTARDFVPCAAVVERLGDQEAALVTALQQSPSE